MYFREIVLKLTCFRVRFAGLKSVYPLLRDKGEYQPLNDKTVDVGTKDGIMCKKVFFLNCVTLCLLPDLVYV